MKDERYKELMESLGMPDSSSLLSVLQQVANETEQNVRAKIKEDEIVPKDPIKQADQIAMLEAARDFTDGKEFPGMFSYPNCGWDLVQQELATEGRKITKAGRAALWFLNKGEDPTETKSSHTFSFDLEKQEKL